MARYHPPDAAELLSIALTSAGLENVLSRITDRFGNSAQVQYQGQMSHPLDHDDRAHSTAVAFTTSSTYVVQSRPRRLFIDIGRQPETHTAQCWLVPY